MAKEKAKGNPPVWKIRDGNLQSDIWCNEREFEGRNGKKVTRNMYSIVLTHSYTPDNGKTWEESDNIPYQDAPRAAQLYNLAFAKVVELRTKESSSKSDDDDDE